jgi:LPS-assembly protein
MSRWTYSLFVIFLVALWLSSAAAAESRSQGEKGRSYQIKADFLNYDHATETFRGRGNASIVGGDQTLRADALEYCQWTKEAKAWGNVRLSSGKGWVTGSRIEMNLEEKTGVIYNGTLFLQKNNFYVRGDEIQKTGRASYYVKDNGRFTSCDGDSPSWEITGTDLKVTVEGYGSIKHAALRAKSVPVFYLPYMILPAKVKRQTGFLMPMVFYSNINGWEAIQPYFWAINNHSDATFNAHYMGHRGWKPGVEYRYVLSEVSKTTAMFDYLHDDQIDDGTGDGFVGFGDDDEDRTNRDRWWFRMKADWELPVEFQAKLDFDIVSDQDYLREFNTIYTGYEYTNDYFKDEFGRELDDKTDTVRRSQLNLNRTWDQFSFNAGLRWYDDAIARKNGDDNTNQQNLPIVTFSGSKQQVSESSFYYDLNTSFLHSWREEGTRGYSVDLYPKMYYPIAVFDVLDFEPSLGIRETLWWVNAYDSSNGGEEDQLKSREVFDFKADLSTEIARVFNVGGESVDKIRHGIRPQVVYNYVPDVEQGDLPDFVGAIGEANVLTYSVTNTFTSRVKEKAEPEQALRLEAEAWEVWAAEPVSIVSEAGQDWGDLVPKFDYHEFCRLSLSQSYDINKARRDPPAGEARHPFSDVSARLELEPFYSYDVRFVGNATWSPYDGKYDWDTTTDVRLENKRGDWVSTTYRYVKDDSSNILVKTFVNLLPTLSIYWEHERNIKDNQDIKSVLGFLYQPQCWSFHLEYTDDRDVNNRQYLFRISLHGLGTYDLGRYKPGESESWYGKG